MRTACVLIGLLASALTATSPAQTSSAAPTDSGQTPAAAEDVVDERVVQEMLKWPHGMPESELREGLRDCDENTRQMKICAAYRWTVQDMRLNRIYAQAPRGSDGVHVMPSLVSAQKAWIAFREAQCAFEGESGAGGGTMEGLYVLHCKEALTRQQADRLELAFNQ